MWLGLQASSWLKKVHSNVILQFCPDTGLCPNHPSKSYPLWYVMPNSKHCKNLEISHHTIRTKQKQSPCTYIFRRSWWLAWSMIQFIPSKSLHPLLIVHELHTKSDCSESDRLTRYSTILNDYVWNHSTIIQFFNKNISSLFMIRLGFRGWYHECLFVWLIDWLMWDSVHLVI